MNLLLNYISHRKYCRRPMDPRFTQKTVKFGGGKIMVWGWGPVWSSMGVCERSAGWKATSIV